MAQVKVIAHPETGNVITPNPNKPEFGTVRLDQTVISRENGFINRSSRTSFLHGKIEDLELMDWKAGQVINGKIVRKQSYEPFYEGQTPKIYPSGHPRAGESVLTNGRESYFQDIYTEDMDAYDGWVSATPEQVGAQTEEALAEQAI